ncbi:PREDICTED: uncharacterized protein LOC109234893 [Nicotiana attenuata]|uniref:uncharacterized protein LOC109234893 n=1 Tax=Nicotiana attenuata TaxID=49451 RepID=UPI000905BD50|nr:PREDICTED: uncharacterized protein LOC109234893 [Nicotiana attenuata]
MAGAPAFAFANFGSYLRTWSIAKPKILSHLRQLQDLLNFTIRGLKREWRHSKKGSSSKPKGYDLCHKCGKPGHFIKDCPLLKQDKYKNNIDKAAKRNPVPDKRFKRKNVADDVVKQALAAWGDSSSESKEDDDQGNSSMMAAENEAAEYDSIFALMAQSDDDGDDDDDDEPKAQTELADPRNLHYVAPCLQNKCQQISPVYEASSPPRTLFFS